MSEILKSRSVNATEDAPSAIGISKLQAEIPVRLLLRGDHVPQYIFAVGVDDDRSVGAVKSDYQKKGRDLGRSTGDQGRILESVGGIMSAAWL